MRFCVPNNKEDSSCKQQRNFITSQINTVGHIAASRNCLSFQPDQHVKIILRAMQNSRTGSAGVVDEKGNLVGLY
jgi:CBS domain-containing protein